MSSIGDDPKLRALLEQAKNKASLLPPTKVTPERALALLESCRQGAAPTRGALIIAVGRHELVKSMRRDLASVASRGSCLRVINGVFGIGKTFTLRILQEYAHMEGFATSFVTISPRECPMDNLPTIYHSIVNGIRTTECPDRSALEEVFEAWAKGVRDNITRRGEVPWTVRELNIDFKLALTHYYEGIQMSRPEQAAAALRWLRGEMTAREVKRLGLTSSLSHKNALSMLGNLTRMLRFVGKRGLVILLDEADAIPSLPSTARREAAYANLLSMARSTSRTPYSYFLYATTPAFFASLPPGYDDAVSNTINLEQLTRVELVELGQQIVDLHFQAYEWRRSGFGQSSIRRFVQTCLRNGIDTPRAFIRAIISALDTCEENEDVTLDKIVITWL